MIQEENNSEDLDFAPSRFPLYLTRSPVSEFFGFVLHLFSFSENLTSAALADGHDGFCQDNYPRRKSTLLHLSNVTAAVVRAYFDRPFGFSVVTC